MLSKLYNVEPLFHVSEILDAAIKGALYIIDFYLILSQIIIVPMCNFNRWRFSSGIFQS